MAWKGTVEPMPIKDPGSLLLLDLDGTLTPVRSPWRYVYERLGNWGTVGETIYSRYISGEIDYTSFCRQDIEAWEKAGANLQTVLGILDEITFPPESVSFVETLLQRGFSLTIVSTGFNRVARNLASRAGFSHPEGLRWVINGIREKDGRMEPVLRVHEGETPRGKGAWARRLVRLSKRPPGRTFAVGDGASDALMFPHVGKGFTVPGPSGLPKILEQLLDEGTRPLAIYQQGYI